MGTLRKTTGAIVQLPLGVPEAGETLQHWLYSSLRQAILEGRLGRGMALPGTRALALQHGIARGTVQAAYNQLISEGYAVAAHGSATRVSPNLPERVPRAETEAEADPAATATAPCLAPSPLPQPRLWTATLEGEGSPFALQPPGGLPPLFQPHRGDVRAFPIDVWRALHVRHLRASRAEVLLDPGPAGLEKLRWQISEHLYVARGVQARPEQIVIMSSMQQALDICLRLLVAPGEQVWMEDPGYPGARLLMQANGAQLVNVPVDAGGMRVEEGIRMAPNARLAYVTPARQAPMAVALSPERRMALLDWAAAAGAYVFEDIYDSEYRLVGKPIPSLLSQPGSEHNVIFSASFSKLLFPGIRLAFVVLPRHLVAPFVRAHSLANRNASGLTQAVLADFFADGHFERHVRRMRRLYAARSQAFMEAASRHWRGLLEVPPSTAGLDIVARLLSMDEASALARLGPAGLVAFPLSRYTATNVLPPALVMGFAPFDEETIDAGARRVAAALRA